MRGLLLALTLLLAACQGQGGGVWELRPPPLSEPIPNPERGFYASGLNLLDPGNEEAIASIARTGLTLVYPYDTWLPPDRPLTNGELNALEQSFARLEKYGLKLILRFRYSEAGDAPIGVIRTHLAQLLPVVRANADLVYVFQAGFLGRWGEWHCWRATGVCHEDFGTKRWLLNTLARELPAGPPIAVRYPVDKVKYLGLSTERPPGKPFYGRIAHFNDCWLANATDAGTYPERNTEAWRAFVYAENDRLPYGGETCAPNPPRTDGPRALAEAARAHLDYLNSEYHDELLAHWREDGTYRALATRLGYRIELVEARWPREVPAGTGFALELTLRNTGFSRLKRPRPAYLVFEKGDRIRAQRIRLDLTGLEAGKTRRWRFVVQPPFLSGGVRLGLWFPDASKRLRNNPRYAVHLASRLPFEDGVNWLGALELR